MASLEKRRHKSNELADVTRRSSADGKGDYIAALVWFATQPIELGQSREQREVECGETAVGANLIGVDC